ncbi:MAG TPA: hypothetical protein VE444_09715 [Gaiellaceae bacterium]|jgi:putative peptide zinc metalloprotease protein|nr:hypothetical protein [Gaiellaceae bacterium]
MTKRLLVLVAAAAAAAVLGLAAGEAPARANGGDSAVVAVNTKDGRFVYRVRLAIHRTGDDVVDQSNAAAAVASCDTCQTVAIAIQALLVFGDPEVVAPENLALALNVECTSCQTLASAYQFLVMDDRPAHFTPEGNRELAAVRHELHTIRHEGLTIWEIQERVDALAARVHAVLVNERVVPGS